ncbi:MAG TPA: 6,7-dimethyl-8-ribityllumazine synthase, partial [Limnochordales bacterium]
MAEFRGKLDGSGLRIGVVVARFNQLVTQQLLAGALDALSQHGVAEGDVDVAWVPGSLELGPAAARMARSGRYDALICLGCVIRGATPHFEMVAQQTARAISQLAMEGAVPVIFGVLTTDTLEQALERAGSKAGNRGY